MGVSTRGPTKSISPPVFGLRCNKYRGLVEDRQGVGAGEDAQQTHAELLLGQVGDIGGRNRAIAQGGEAGDQRVGEVELALSPRNGRYSIVGDRGPPRVERSAKPADTVIDRVTSADVQRPGDVGDAERRAHPSHETLQQGLQVPAAHRADVKDVADENVPETIGCRGLYIDSPESVRDSAREPSDRQITLPGKNKLVNLNREGLQIATGPSGLQVEQRHRIPWEVGGQVGVKLVHERTKPHRQEQTNSASFSLATPELTLGFAQRRGPAPANAGGPATTG